MRLTAFFHPLARMATVTLLAALSLAGCGSTTPARPDAGTQPALSSSAPPVRIGIALGGGAAKGFAHIGVIKMLEANGFAPAVVSGTSAGSVVGALYASGMNAFEMQEKAVALDEAKIRDLQLSSGGLVLGQKLEDYVNEQVRRKPLEQMAKPFVVVATRLEDGERTVFARGNTGQADREAFAAYLPACTVPVCYNGDVTTVDDLRALEAAFPGLSGIMVGRGLIADPALLRKAVGGPAASREELRGYHDELYHGYTEAFGMASCAVSRMKAHWFYLIHLFDGADALEKPLRKAREGWEYETVVNQIFACWPK